MTEPLPTPLEAADRVALWLDQWRPDRHQTYSLARADLHVLIAAARTSTHAPPSSDDSAFTSDTRQALADAGLNEHQIDCVEAYYAGRHSVGIGRDPREFLNIPAQPGEITPPGGDIAARLLAQNLDKVRVVAGLEPDVDIDDVLDAVAAGRRARADSAPSPAPLNAELSAEIDGVRARLATALDVLDDVLRHFSQRGHPGRESLRTGWIDLEAVNAWRATAGQLRAGRAHAPAPRGEEDAERPAAGEVPSRLVEFSGGPTVSGERRVPVTSGALPSTVVAHDADGCACIYVLAYDEDEAPFYDYSGEPEGNEITRCARVLPPALPSPLPVDRDAATEAER